MTTQSQALNQQANELTLRGPQILARHEELLEINHRPLTLEEEDELRSLDWDIDFLCELQEVDCMTELNF